MSVMQIGKNNFDIINNSSETVLLDFHSDRCGPCRMLSPIIDEIATERDDITVGKINVDSETEIASEFKVVSIPTLIVIRDGKVINRAVGIRPKRQILKLLEN